MNNRLLLLIACTIFLSGCVEKDDLRSQISVNQQNFVISSIQSSQNNQIFCVGYTHNLDSCVVIEFNSKLVQIRKTNVNRNGSFKGKLKLTKLKIGWLILEETENNTLEAHKTDDDFKIISSRIIQNSGVGSFTAQPTKSGGFLITMDTIPNGTNQFHSDGIVIQKLNADLGDIFVFKGKAFSSTSTNIYGPLAYELTDESIMFCFTGDSVYYRNSYIVAGKLSSSGVLEFQYANEVFRRFLDPISLSQGQNNFILSSLNGVERQVAYTLIDHGNGRIIKESSLTYNYQNHQLNKTWPGAGYNVPSEGNPLPLDLNSKGGHLVFNKDYGELNFVMVDGNANYTIGFTPVLPEFEKIYAYRQHFLSNTSLIIGISYQYQNKAYFNLQQVDI